VPCSKLDNVLVSLGDITKAQEFADRFQSLDWPRVLNRYAGLVNPQMHDILRPFQYYRVTTQSEYSTDVIFNSRQGLCELSPQLLSHSTLCFGAKEVMNFLGGKLNGHFQAEIVSDLSGFVCRRTGGSEIKHRVKDSLVNRLRIEYLHPVPGAVRESRVLAASVRDFPWGVQIPYGCRRGERREDSRSADLMDWVGDR
jgi:hypothetical protein